VAGAGAAIVWTIDGSALAFLWIVIVRSIVRTLGATRGDAPVAEAVTGPESPAATEIAPASSAATIPAAITIADRFFIP
jgi:hypothetical protein